MNTIPLSDDDKNLEPFLTAEQCAALLNTSIFSLRRWTKKYGIPTYKHGPKSVRYLYSEVVKALENNGLNPPRRMPQGILGVNTKTPLPQASADTSPATPFAPATTKKEEKP